MKVIFCLTSPRSGTKYLADIFKYNVKNCIAKHEPFPDMFGKFIYWYQEGKYKKIKERFNLKKFLINLHKTDVYLETNHSFLKSFADVAIEAYPDMKLIHLIRNPLMVAKSNLNKYKIIKNNLLLCSYNGDDGKKYYKWSFTGKEDIYKKYGFNENTIFEINDEPKIYKFFLIQWIETENRAINFLNKYKKHNDNYTLNIPRDLNDPIVLKDMFKFLGLELNQDEICFKGKKNSNPVQTIVSDQDQEYLREVISKLPDSYLKIFREKPYLDFEWVKIFHKT